VWGRRIDEVDRVHGSKRRDVGAVVGDRMKIAMVAPPWFEVPPEGYGGIEQMVATLVHGLERSGDEVTLIAAGENRTEAEFAQTFRSTPEGLGGPDSLPIELIHAQRTAELLRDLHVDVVHDHSVVGPLFAPYRSVPTVVTIHGPVAGWMRRLYASMRSVGLVAISNAQRADAPELPWVATVYNGIDVGAAPFRAEKGAWFLFLGRIHPTKGVREAIEVARAAGGRLLIAAKASDEAEQRYLEDEVQPLLAEDAVYLGDVDGTRKQELLADARALLFPIRWEEPFGLVMIEAMACGTPVVAMRRGSVPEVVDHDVTGFVCESIEEMVDACGQLGTLDPADIRQRCAERFDGSVMTRGYRDVYRSVTRGDGADREAEHLDAPSLTEGLG
jgi:glycosyltransferase involved in cell wall biosynthesis